jgi:thiamine pyrophosphokinase
MGTAVVFAGGPTSHPSGPCRAPGVEPPCAELVIAADSGLDLAVALGHRVDLVVGDMDSVTPEALEQAERDGAEVRRHPTDKDATDLELALDAAVAAGCDRIVVIGSSRGRMDHLLGGTLVLASPRYAAVEVAGWLGGALVVPVHDRRTLDVAPGSIVSLMPVHGAAEDVSTVGLRWPLRSERLEPGSSRGASNEAVAERVEVSVSRGTLLVVLPEREEVAP